VLVGEEMRVLARELGKAPGQPLGFAGGFTHCDNAAEAIGALSEYGVVAGDAVLVKGSNSVGLGQLVDHFTRRDG
jgi:UDP-N-acetylmuramoyl-tripeptide--D-alanyl-D-alanine ligase